MVPSVGALQNDCLDSSQSEVSFLPPKSWTHVTPDCLKARQLGLKLNP